MSFLALPIGLVGSVVRNHATGCKTASYWYEPDWALFTIGVLQREGTTPCDLSVIAQHRYDTEDSWTYASDLISITSLQTVGLEVENVRDWLRLAFATVNGTSDAWLRLSITGPFSEGSLKFLKDPT